MSKKDKPQTDFRKILEPITRHHDTRKVFDAFVRFAACALAAQTREPEYFEELKRWNKDEMKCFADALGALILEMEQRPFEDIIGCYYMEFALSTKGQQWNGEFHTPQSICELMAGITYGDGSEFPAEGPITVCEPACGAGAMILALAKVVTPQVRRRLRVTAIDINRTACDMTFINTTLWGIPCRVLHGNTLSMEFWNAWSNIHYRMPFLSLLMNEQGQPPKLTEIENIKTALGQQELAFA